jgi:DNA-binding transcriptional LysR family regulator
VRPNQAADADLVELDWLETFLAVVDRGGFTSASTQVHRSQSRVSAHIAALEKDLGVRLIDRSRRPATATEAGRILAVHARAILAEIAASRAELALLRDMQSRSLTVLTTPSIGAVLLPQVVSGMLVQHPDASVVVSERGWRSRDPEDLAGGFAVAVVPTLALPHVLGLREHLLWREPIRVVVPARHEFARADEPVQLSRLVQHPLLVGGSSLDPEPEISSLLTARGHSAAPRARLDDASTLVEMVRHGLGVGVERATALEMVDTAELVVLDIADPEMVSEVAVYWYDALLATDLGQTLHQMLVEAPLPEGAVALGRSMDADSMPA